MESQIVEAAALTGSVAADLSLWSLVLRADIVVKIVMLVLIGASVWSWAIIFRRLSEQADRFEAEFWSGGSLEELFDSQAQSPDHPMAVLFASAMREWRRSTERGLVPQDTLRAGLRERIGQAMQLAHSREMAGLERYLGFLATVGSTAPFVGLFGTA